MVQEIKNKRVLRIGKGYLVKALRRWRFYKNTIKAQVNHWMLNIPSDDLGNLPLALQTYIKFGQRNGSAQSAMNAFGKYWYSHVHTQIESKQPFGRVFIPDKIDLRFTHRGVIANYANPRITASKNFYIVMGLDEKLSKVLIGWLNSVFFVAMLTLSGRKISRYWTRFLENDYLERPILNLKAMNSRIISAICKNMDSILDRELPPFWNQLDHSYRFALDRSIAEAIGVDDPEGLVSNLYGILRPRFTSSS